MKHLSVILTEEQQGSAADLLQRIGILQMEADKIQVQTEPLLAELRTLIEAAEKRHGGNLVGQSFALGETGLIIERIESGARMIDLDKLRHLSVLEGTIEAAMERTPDRDIRVRVTQAFINKRLAL